MWTVVARDGSNHLGCKRMWRIIAQGGPNHLARQEPFKLLVTGWRSVSVQVRRAPPVPR